MALWGEQENGKKSVAGKAVPKRIRLAEAIGIPKEVAKGCVMVSTVGNRDVCIENYHSILEYTDTCIRLRVQNGNLVILGTGLSILYYNDIELQLRGCISQIVFENR